MYEFSVAYLNQWLGKPQLLQAGFAATKLILANKAQGAAFHGGALWVSSSTSTSGTLTRTASPVVTAFGFGPGVEEFEFDGNGDLWAVFEAGTAPDYLGAFYPVIARFDPALIDAAP